MRSFLLGMITVLYLSGCSTLGGEDRAIPDLELNLPNQTDEVELRKYGSAPELTNSVWLNADDSLLLADLRGKVVLVDFWTFG